DAYSLRSTEYWLSTTHTSLGAELSNLSKSSDQRVVEKSQLLQKRLKVSLCEMCKTACQHVTTSLGASKEGCTTSLGASEEGWNRSSEIDDLIWSRGKEIAESKVRLSVSEILAKYHLPTKSVVPEAKAILVVQAEGTRKDESVFQDMESNGNDVNEKVNEDAIVVDEVDKNKLYEGVANDTPGSIWSIVMECFEK
ncbi:29723_t:CDS:2, partial [Gigaspora margarita]